MTTSREFTSDDMLALFAEVYDNRRSRTARVLDLLAQLRAEDGTVVQEVSEERQSSAAPNGGASSHAFSPQLSLADVPRFLCRSCGSAVEPHGTFNSEPGHSHSRALTLGVSFLPTYVICAVRAGQQRSVEP